MYKHLLLLISLVVASFGAKANVETKMVKISCSSKIYKQELNHTIEVEKVIVKNVKVRTNFFNSNIEMIKFSEKIQMDAEYSVRINYDERIDLETLFRETEINGTLFRHRVGNGKIVLGESKTLQENRNYVALSEVDVEIVNFKDLNRILALGFRGTSKANSFEQAVNYGLLVKGVVKSALIKCKTL